MTKYKYGWKRQLPDIRDKKFGVSVGAPLPKAVDLRPDMPPVYDQGQLGSCTANAIAGAIQYLCNKGHYKWPFTPSRLFIYYNERAMEGTVWQDAGAYIRDGIKTVNSQGVCPEDSKAAWNWAYSDDTFRFRMKPSAACYKDAVMHKAISYEAVPQSEVGLKTVLAAGLPIVLGIAVYDSFESADATRTGDIPMPNAKTESVLGGHAVLIVGYDEAKRKFIFRNSWADTWGNKGYGTFPYDYLTNPDLCSDIWAISVVKN